jgi:hypothetical protein
MMQSPDQIAQVVRQALTAGPANTPNADPRVQIAHLSTAATIAAMRGGCNCKACKMLRRMVDIQMAEAEKELGDDVDSGNPEA